MSPIPRPIREARVDAADDWKQGAHQEGRHEHDGEGNGEDAEAVAPPDFCALNEADLRDVKYFSRRRLSFFPFLCSTSYGVRAVL